MDHWSANVPAPCTGDDTLYLKVKAQLSQTCGIEQTQQQNLEKCPSFSLLILNGTTAIILAVIAKQDVNSLLKDVDMVREMAA